MTVNSSSDHPTGFTIGWIDVRTTTGEQLSMCSSEYAIWIRACNICIHVYIYIYHVCKKNPVCLWNKVIKALCVDMHRPQSLYVQHQRRSSDVACLPLSNCQVCQVMTPVTKRTREVGFCSLTKGCSGSFAPFFDFVVWWHVIHSNHGIFVMISRSWFFGVPGSCGRSWRRQLVRWLDIARQKASR